MSFSTSLSAFGVVTIFNFSHSDRCVVVSHVCFFKNKLIYLFLTALGLCCCAQAFSSCGERGLLFVEVRRQSTGSRRAGFSSCGMRAQ